MRTPRLSANVAVALVLVAWVIGALGLLGVFVYATHVQAEARDTAEAFSLENRRGIAQGCLDREAIKRAIRDLVNLSIRSALEDRANLTPRQLERIAEYRALVERTLGESPCIPPTEGSTSNG